MYFWTNYPLKSTAGAGDIVNGFDATTKDFVVFPAGNLSYLAGSAVNDFASIASGSSAFVDVPVAGAVLGDQAVASLGLALGGLTISAAVQAANSVRVTLSNPTGGAIDLASTTVYVRVLPKAAIGQ